MQKIVVILLICLWHITSIAESLVTSSKTPLELIISARASLDTNPEDTIESLNVLLLLPSNEYTGEAAELIGLAYEKSGKIEKAKLEYASFLSSYPDSESAQRIRMRLLALEIATPKVIVNRLQAKTPHIGKEVKISGSTSAYYYASSMTPEPAKWISSQYSLIENVNVTGLFKNNEYQTKIVYRYSHLNNFMDTSGNRSRLYTLFAEVENTYLGYIIKVGRQYPLYGAIGRFDGVMAKYNLDDSLELFAQTGIPYTGSESTHRVFYGFGANKIIDASLSGTLYYNYQVADKFPERSAIGSELRYFKNDLSFLAIVEYDTLYKIFNSRLFQSNMTVGAYGIYAMVDIRKSPVLFADRALDLGMASSSHQSYSSVSELITSSRLSTSDIHKYISESTPTGTIYVLGLSRRVSNKWNISFDVQSAEISSTTVSNIPTLDITSDQLSRPGSGTSFSLGTHLSGNDVLAKKNTIDILYSKTKDRNSNSFTATAVNGISINDTHVDMLIRYFKRSQSNVDTNIITTSIRYNHKISERLSLDSQISLDKTNTVDKLTSIHTNMYNKSLFVGLRHDF